MTSPPAGAEIFVGLMSGTSADGMDAVAVRFPGRTPEILCRHHLSYPAALRQRIRDAATNPRVAVTEVMTLDRELGLTSARLVKALLSGSGLEKSRVRAIGSHGQTIRHLPEYRCTWQIGDPNLIAQETGLTTVADLRRRDMAAGGQGAPLAPAFHNFAFRVTGENRVIVNLGGMANLTWLPADPRAAVTGFDTGPGNRLLDHWIHAKLDKPFDDRGTWAASGKVHSPLLDDMLADSYFNQAPPKSTGPERFSGDWLRGHLENHPQLPAADVQATLTELTATTLARDILSLRPRPDAVFLCGGGVHNANLVERIAAALNGIQLSRTDDLGVPAGLVEPVAFAWLARETLSGRAGNLPAVTGASEAVVLGAIYPAC